MDSAIKETKPAGLIAVMGGTGTGKSSFINAIVGKDVTEVGHSLESETSEIKEYDFLMPNGLHVTLVDTPGFDDSNTRRGDKSDLDILRDISTFLKAKYNEKRKFSGILYLLNISDPKVGAASLRSISMFKKLCGSESLKNVVVVTTFWDAIESLEQGIESETELKTKDKFFKELVDGKSKFVRYGKPDQGQLLEGAEFPPPISLVYDLVALDPVFVKMQKELAEGKTVMETSAGAELYKELQELKLQQKKDVIDLKKRIEAMRAINDSDKEARKTLERESSAMKTRIKELEATHNDLHRAVHSGRAEWGSAIAQLKREKETSAKRDLELEDIRRAELKSEVELLKILHAKEILECQFQIRSLLDGNAVDAFRKTQLEKTCEDLKGTVSGLSLSLTKLRDTNEREAVERIDLMRECNQLRASAATHRKTLDDLAEARSNITQMKSQVQASQTAQERTTSELDKVKSTLANVKDGTEIAAATQAKTMSELNTVRAALADAKSKFLASQDAQSNMASELEEARLALAKVRSELNASVNKCAETESHLQESRTALERTKSELFKAREAYARSSSPSPWESPRNTATPRPPVIDGIPEGSECEEGWPLTESPQSPPSLPNMLSSLTNARQPWAKGASDLRPQSPFRRNTTSPPYQQPTASHTPPPVHPDSHIHRRPRYQPTAPVFSQFLPQHDNFSGGFVPQQPSFPMPQGVPFGMPTQSPPQYYYD